MEKCRKSGNTALFLCAKIKTEVKGMNRDVCPECGCSLRITGSKNVVEGDSSKDTETRLFNVLTMECMNPRCAAFGNKKEIRNEQPIG